MYAAAQNFQRARPISERQKWHQKDFHAVDGGILQQLIQESSIARAYQFRPPMYGFIAGQDYQARFTGFLSKLWHGRQLTSKRLPAMLGDYKCPPRGCLGNLHL